MYKKYCFLFLFSFSFIPIFCLCLNLLVDPFNYFKHSAVNIVSTTNERNVKLAFLKNAPLKYDSVMLGSSRSSYINVQVFKNYKMFNLSVSGISIEEYLPYLRFFEQTQGVPKLIILSLDFHATNENLVNRVDPNLALSHGNSKFKQLLEYIKLKTSHISLNMLFPIKLNDYYTREFIKKRSEEPKRLNEETIQGTIAYYNNYCLRRYTYDHKYGKYLKSIKDAFPQSKIIVIICPIHQSLFNFQNEVVGKKIYVRWLYELEEIFNDIIDFNHEKEIVSNNMNFFDPAHFYPFIGDYMVHKIQDESSI